MNETLPNVMYSSSCGDGGGEGGGDSAGGDGGSGGEEGAGDSAGSSPAAKMSNINESSICQLLINQ